MQSFKLQVVAEVERGELSIRGTLRKYGIQSHSTVLGWLRKYGTYANAIAERVNGILKQEFLLEEYNCDMLTLKAIVKESVAIYNTNRPHLSCYMLTPEQMHRQQGLIRPTYSKAKPANEMLAGSNKINNFVSSIL